MSGLTITRGLAAAIASLSAAGAAQAATELGSTSSLSPVVVPFAGEIDADYGRIRTWSGEATPLYGRIRTWWGDVSPYYGRIRTWWGDIDPSYGRIRTWQGEITAEYGRIRTWEGDVEAFYGRIRTWEESGDAFTAQLGALNSDFAAQYGRIRTWDGDFRPFQGHVAAFWHLAGVSWAQTSELWSAAATDPGKYAVVDAQLDQLVDRSAAFWGASVTAKTGKTFEQGFAAPLFAKYGIDRSDPASLASLSASDRGFFFLDWYDGLMAFSGTDRIDHWMATINWSPTLSQIQGGGSGVKVGLLDFAITNDADIRSKIEFTKQLYSYDSSKSPAVASTHGTAVASLIFASHDGKGLMGIAPNARLIHMDPFDYDETANFQEIQTGIKELGNKGASVVNLSLGVPNWTLHPEWKRVFASGDLTDYVGKVAWVISAGNDGVTQLRDNHDGILNSTGAPQDAGKIKDGTGEIVGLAAVGTLNAIKFDKNKVPALLVVGSVDPSGVISDFSNRPGDACLFTVSGPCDAFGRIADRFVVAPGELLLVSDGNGGTTRMSGTSFAAPLVTGAIALLQDRWPWLKAKPRETTDIILRSAKDLGAPGTDGVYGRGLLDVEASQSPLDFGALTYKEYSGGKIVSRTASQVRSNGTNAGWEAAGAYFYAFENIGSTYRDFAIPLSSKLVGQTTSAGGSAEYFQTYLSSRFTDWMVGGFTDVATQRVTSGTSGLSIAATAGTRPASDAERRGGAGFAPTRGVVVQAGGLGFRFGSGDGALALGSGTGFTLFSDHDAVSGGVNPLLGFASGGAYASGELLVAPAVRVSVGFSQQRERDLRLGFGQRGVVAVDAASRPYRAGAMNVSATWTASPRVTLTTAVTMLEEDSALLGVQSVDPSDLRNGATSRGVTMGGAFELGRGLTLATSATLAQTEADGRAQNLGVAPGGLTGSAFQIAVTKAGIVGNDRLRLSVAQPLHLERGEFEYTSVQVIDRETGELGPVTQRFGLSSPRRLVTEAIYAFGLPDNFGELSAFGRADVGDAPAAGQARYMVGGRWTTRF